MHRASATCAPRRLKKTHLDHPARGFQRRVLSARILSARILSALLLCTLAGNASPTLFADEAILAPPGEAVRVPLLLRQGHTTHRVLYVTAHPDDEDAGLIARLVHGEGVAVTLLTLTRGNGGQNEIGPELHGAIAALRTAELESAHRWDGASQWFGSADDFGYSFSVDETLEQWGEQRMLAELVEAIRLCRPDVIFTLPPSGDGGGQHHQASAQLTHRALELAATDRWPDLGPPHQTARLFSVIWGDEEGDFPCEVPLDGYDTLLGGSYAEVGSRSRSMHKCQGMVRVDPPLPRRVVRLDLRFDADAPLAVLGHPLQGIPARHFERDGAKTPLATSMAKFTAEFGPFAERSMVPAIAAIEPLLAAERELDPSSPALDDLEATLAAIAFEALGLRVRAAAARPFTASGEEAAITVALENRGEFPVTLDLALVSPGAPVIAIAATLPGGERILRTVTLPRGLKSELLDGPTGREIPARGAPIRLVGRVTCALDSARADTTQWSFSAPPIVVEGVWRDEVFPTLRATNLRVVPDPSIRPAHQVEIAPRRAGEDAIAHGEFLASTLVPATLEVWLTADDGSWSVTPHHVLVETPGNGIEVSIPFAATAPEAAGTIETAITATAAQLDESGESGPPSDRGYRRIEYPHIRTTALEEAARVTVTAFPCEVSPRAIGWIGGVGEDIPRAITALGLELVPLEGIDLTDGDLSRFETIVIGIRAYKIRGDLRAAQGRLMAWVRAGGTLVVQYQKFEFNDSERSSPYVPYPGAYVGRGRVTDETALVATNEPDHPLLRQPNRITQADWHGWIQERGLYFLDVRADAPYLDLLTIADSFPYNSGIKGGALVEAEVGDGKWIYVGLGLWRQVPAGVPGSVRILANLLAR